MLKQKVIDILTKKLGIDKFVLLTPKNSSFGDCAIHINQLKDKKIKIQDFVKQLKKEEIFEKVEEKSGFINFFISKKTLVKEIEKIIEQKDNYGKSNINAGKKVMVEFAHPNTHKLFHIGHLRNISSGESLCRILEAAGNAVIRTNYQGDVGLHIAKCLWQVKKEKGLKFKTLADKIKFLGKMYAKGNKAYETDEKAKKEIIEVNKMIYKQGGGIIPLWKETRQWSLDYFAEIYQRVYTKFDRLYFESELPKRSMEIVEECLKKGILKKSEGAIVFKGKSYSLDTRVFVNALGIPTYEGKELALAEREFCEFGIIDKCIHVVGPEQSSFFKVTFKVEELLDPKKYKNKQLHLVGGWVRLKHGKMSSRSGVVVEGPWLLDEAKRKIIKKYQCEEKIAETLAVASVKYSFLKNNISADIVFNFDESVSIEGNSGPYLLYTYVRTQSVLKKAKNYLNKNRLLDNLNNLEKEEKELLRSLNQFSEIVEEAAKNLSPNLIANYLFNLAQKYNLFYQKCRILEAEEDLKNFRLSLTKATGQIIKNGLYLLVIKTVEKM